MKVQDRQKKRMSQSEIVDHLASKTGSDRAAVKTMLEKLADLGSESVRKHGEFPLPGFGKLVLSQRKARVGRNPLTGATIEIPSTSVLKFRLKKDLKAIVIGSPTEQTEHEVPTAEPITRPDY